MPELPDVEVWRKYVDATALHHEITNIEIRAPDMLVGISPRLLAARMRDNRLEVTKRHGKYLFIGLNNGFWLTLHFGMTGRLSYFKHSRTIPAHTRLFIAFSNGFHLAYDCQRKLGRIALTVNPDTFVRQQGLGVDALDPDLTVDTLVRLLRKRHGAIKAILMDQHLIAGIGNLYADEILFQAHIHPQCCAGELNDHSLHKVFRAMRRVLQMAIERGADPDRLPASWLLLSRHRGGACPRCRAGLSRIKVSGRTSYVCPRCQLQDEMASATRGARR